LASAFHHRGADGRQRRERVTARHRVLDSDGSAEGFTTTWGIPDDSMPNRLAGITQPTFVANYEQFAEGYFLSAKMMAWFWDAYEPDVERRLEPLASPLRAGGEQLGGLPPALLIVGEADVLRDEGEAYAARLRAAGTAVTTVRYDTITHDFMMLNALSDTHATRAAIAQAIATLRNALNTT
jgi:acetyl esterase/lipase